MDPLTNLPDISFFEPKGIGKNLADQINDIANQINSIRDSNKGLPPETVDQVVREILIDRVHESNAIEGNHLDRRETIHVLATGQIVESKRRSSTEALNLISAITQAESLIIESEIREIDIRGLHGILMKDLLDDAGAYRTEAVKIDGAKFQPPEPGAVPALMSELVSKYNEQSKQSSAIAAACFLHWSMARIHPFRDGNGRMSRLLQDFSLLQNKLVPAAIPQASVNEYYSALQMTDEGHPTDFIELIAENVLRYTVKYQTAIERTIGRTQFVQNIAQMAGAKRKNDRHAKFLRWQSKMVELKSQFFALSQELSDAIPELTVRIKDDGSLPFDQYENICGQKKFTNTWDFRLDFKLQDFQLRYVFWYAKHIRRPWDTIQISREPVLLISVEETPEYYSLLYDTAEDKVSLREVALDSNRKYIRIRHDPTKPHSVFDENVTSVQIAQDFFTEVLQNKLGLY